MTAPEFHPEVGPSSFAGCGGVANDQQLPASSSDIAFREQSKSIKIEMAGCVCLRIVWPPSFILIL